MIDKAQKIALSLILDFEYFNGRARTFVLYTKTNEEIELKKSVFSFESYSEN